MPTTFPRALTTSAKIKSQLGISVADFDTILEGFIASASMFIESSCNTRFKRATYTQEIYDGSYPDGSKKSLLVLKNAPLVSIAAFQYRTGNKDNPNWVDLPTINFQEIPESGTVKANMPAGIQNIRVTYTAGYLVDFTDIYDDTKHTLPFDITDLCERLVIRRFKKRESEGRSSESFNNSSITWSKEMDEVDNAVLENYRRVFIS